MKYVFFGTPEFAAIIIEKLIKAGFTPEAVICNPDRPVGRKKIVTPPPVKQRIMNYELGIREKIKILQPEKLEKGLFRTIALAMTEDVSLRATEDVSLRATEDVSLRAEGEAISTPKYRPDLFIVAAYAKILPKEILEIPRLGAIGVHPSLLPKYRGPSPVQAAILNGDSETGVTLFLMDEKIDHGPILAKRELPITNNDDYDTLNRKLAELGADLLIQFLGSPAIKKLTFNIQDESQATYTKKFKTEDAYVDLTKDDPVIIERKVRALNPEPGVFTLRPSKGGLRRMKILEAELADGKLKLIKIQIEGKKLVEI